MKTTRRSHSQTRSRFGRCAGSLLFGAAFVLLGGKTARADSPLHLQPATTTIVVDAAKDYNTRLAAQTLQQWLRKVYRVDTGFAIVPEVAFTNTTDHAILALGRTRWADSGSLAKLATDGFLIERKTNVVVIAGAGPRGTLLGAVGFLDRFGDVRFYMPGDLFTSLPAQKEIVLGAVQVREEPYVKSCSMSGIGGAPGDGEWAARNGTLRLLGGTHQHNMYAVFPPDKYVAKYPEIYPIRNGKRYIPKDARDQAWQPCFSEPKLVDVAEESALDYFTKHPDDVYLAFSINDSQAICECERCTAIYDQFKKADPKLGLATAYSQIYWTFMNQLAARLETKLPGKYIIGLAYGLTRIPPPFLLRPNIIVFANFHVAELDGDGFLKPGATGISPLDQWLHVAKEFGNHDWYQGNGYLLPRIYTGYWAQFMAHLKAHNVGHFMHAEAYPNWGLDGPKLYILARQWWNPDVDAPTLWKQFCGDMFGPAADPMDAYFMKLEKLWIVLDDQEGPERKLSRWNTQFKSSAKDREEIRQCRALLDQALGQAVTDEQKKRIELFSKTFRFTEYLFEFAAAESISPAKVQEAREYARKVIIPDPMTLFPVLRNPSVLDTAINAAIAGKPLQK